MPGGAWWLHLFAASGATSKGGGRHLGRFERMTTTTRTKETPMTTTATTARTPALNLFNALLAAVVLALLVIPGCGGGHDWKQCDLQTGVCKSVDFDPDTGEVTSDESADSEADDSESDSESDGADNKEPSPSDDEV